MFTLKDLEAQLKKERRAAGTIKAHVRTARLFSSYLEDLGKPADIDLATPDDITAFVEDLAAQGGSAKGLYWSLHNYYRISGNELLYKHAVDARLKAMEPEKKRRPAPKLGILVGASDTAVKALAHRDIKTTKQLLPLVQREEEREELARECGVPRADIDDLACFADLSRITDIKGKRGRFLIEGGILSVRQLRDWDPTDLLTHLTEVAAAVGVRPPTAVETKYWVDQAKKLPTGIEIG